MKKQLRPLILAASIAAFSQPSHALFGMGDVVHDPVTMAAMVANMAKEYGIETKQLLNLVQQLQTMKNMYDTLQNDPVSALKREAFNQMMSRLPPQFSTLINGGGNIGNWEGIADDNVYYNIKDAPIEQDSETYRQFEENRKLVAKHSGTFRKLVEDSDFNFKSIGDLVDKMKQAQTVGQKLDNIAESNLINATLLNQIVKNQATAEAYKAEQDLAAQKNRERAMKPKYGTTPVFGIGASRQSAVFGEEENIFQDQF